MIELLSLLIVLAYFNSKRDKPKFCYNPLTEEELTEVKRRSKIFLEKYPDALVGEAFPDIRDEVLLNIEINKLDVLYRSGKIDQIDYERRMHPLMEKITVDINQ